MDIHLYRKRRLTGIGGWEGVEHGGGGVGRTGGGASYERGGVINF